MAYSIVIPVLNEARALPDALKTLQIARAQGAEIILVDGGSSDNTREFAKELEGISFDKFATSAPGRAVQMNVGAAMASNPLLVFLHIDTYLDESCCRALNRYSKSERIWGRFNVVLSGQHFLFRIIETMMNLRSRLTGVVTGDQVLFISRAFFHEVGGFEELPLMEDIELSKRLRKIQWPVSSSVLVKTSSRRWEQYGILKVIFIMWGLRLAYFLGVSPDKLAGYYE